LAFKRLAINIVGWAFVLLGVLGLFLPVLQGVLFILIGLLILSSEYHWARRLLERLKRRFPRLAATAHEANLRARAWLRRLGGRNSA
jgi:uncharacterized protein (TIGR02611 family)